jgi:hypothetical protein
MLEHVVLGLIMLPRLHSRTKLALELVAVPRKPPASVLR